MAVDPINRDIMSTSSPYSPPPPKVKRRKAGQLPSQSPSKQVRLISHISIKIRGINEIKAPNLSKRGKSKKCTKSQSVHNHAIISLGKQGCVH
jgi:hypothetical protein